MTTAVLETGAVFALEDRFSLGLNKLVAGLSKAEGSTKALQAQLDRLGLGAAQTKIGAELERITGSASATAEKIEGRFAALQKGVVGSFDGIKAASTVTFTSFVEGSDKAAASVVGNVGHMRQGVVDQLDIVKTSAAGLWTGMTDGAEAASAGVVAAMGKIGSAVDAPLASVRALLSETNAAVERMGALSAASGVSAAEAAAANMPGARLGHRSSHGGPHFGRVGTEIPGSHASVAGGPATAAAGVLAFGIYEAAQMRDEIQRLMLTGQVEPEKFGSTRGQFEKLMMDAASTTGFSVKQVGEALAKSERALAGVDVGTKMNVTQALIPYAATEARLKGTGLAEALETMVGLSHMTGVFDVEGVKDLARKFSFVSLATNASLPSFEKTLSYSMPVLRTGMNMNPDTIMALTAASQNAGITSTKSGTWLRSFFQESEPAVGDSPKALKHNNALRAMGLLDEQNKPTWKVTGADGRVDWNASVVKEGGIIRDHLAGVPVDERMGTVKNVWGERGGAMASMLSMNTFLDQFAIIAKKIQNFQGGSSAIEEYTRDNPAQKARETWRDFENVLMNIGDKTLPTVNSALTALDDALKRLPADWEATKAQWGAKVDAVEKVMESAADKLKVTGDALGKIPGLGVPFRDQSKPAFHQEDIPPSGFQLNAYRTDTFGGEGNSLEETIYRGTLRAFTSFANGSKIGGVGDVTGGSGFMNASWSGGAPNLSGADRTGGPAIGHFYSAAVREANIRTYAASIGADPRVAMAVARSEGFGRFDGDHGTSFGDFQMHIGGGLGDRFRRATGKNPADPKNELELDRFALDQAKQGGWAPWHGAARIGVHGSYGFGHAPMPAVTAPPRRPITPGSPGMSAMNMPPIVIENHNHTHLDGKQIAKSVTRSQVAKMVRPASVGGFDGHSMYGGEAAVPDSA